MIIMRAKIDNFYCFKNFDINFSYKKKLPTSSIDNEYLEDYPNFRFKKVNVIMGCNASGKTAFGKMLMAIMNFIKYKREKLLLEGITNSKRKATFRIDFAIRNGKKYFLYTLEAGIKENIFTFLKFDKIALNKRDSYESALTRMIKNKKAVIVENKVNKKLIDENDSINNTAETNSTAILTNEMIDILNQINSLGWFFCFPDDDYSGNEYDLNILNHILKAFDNSILKIEKVKNAKNGYLIHFEHGKNILIQDGKASGGNILSSGTKEGLAIAYVITSMMKSSERPFYVDEKFSYAHTDIEKAIFSLMIDLVGKEDQLFFTTHNLDLLEMDLPMHSYVFFGKINGKIRTVYPEEVIINKNDRNLKNYVLNNVFNTIPDTNSIDNLRELLLN